MASLSQPVRVGDVIGETASFIRAEWRILLVLVAPVVLAAVTQIAGLEAAGLRQTPEQMYDGDNARISFILTGLSTIVGHWVGAAILAFALDRLAGQSPGVAAAFRRGLALFLSLLGVRILVYGASWLGLIFFFVPGIMIYTALYVADAACAAERPGLLASLRRSRELTRGSRWQVFILVLMMFALVILVSYMAQGVRDLHVSASIGLSVITNALLYSLSPVLTAVLFHRLRSAREGGTAEEIAALF